jgi:hypothetical protein
VENCSYLTSFPSFLFSGLIQFPRSRNVENPSEMPKTSSKLSPQKRNKLFALSSRPCHFCEGFCCLSVVFCMLLISWSKTFRVSEKLGFFGRFRYTTTITYAWGREEKNIREKATGYLDELILRVCVDDHDQFECMQLL